ncbi:hypothetical protein F4802DRAFT_620296 [Xylaria palmicola]|nr:hypothetical protein F4802DRAFT_620296 [Xylaria palmicola]
MAVATMESNGDVPGLGSRISADVFTPDVLLSMENTASESCLSQLLAEPPERELVERFVQDILRQKGFLPDSHPPTPAPAPASTADSAKAAVRLGLASLAAFLQANVTGPVLENPQLADAVFLEAFRSARKSQTPAGDAPVPGPTMDGFRWLCQRSLDTDGVSPYPYIPHIELFCLARFLFVTSHIISTEGSDPIARHLAWTRFRVHLWHYKLLTQPSLGPGSLYANSGRWTDVATLEELIKTSLTEAESDVVGAGHSGAATTESSWPSESQVLFRLEEANCHILLGNDAKARQAIREAARISGFTYALSGALGKRTRYQESSFSQLVVLAKSLQLSSESAQEQDGKEVAPQALPLNDDTLLESIKFNNEEPTSSASSLPVQLQDVRSDNQPELRPIDQIILLTEATLKDTFSPSDSLTLEEILPYAVRVINDKSVNWQIYTQALLVRSRIELNRSRTVERGVLQMQAVADQVIVDTQSPSPAAAAASEPSSNADLPTIQVTADGESASANTDKPTSFLPAPKQSESATAKERLRYVNALASPPRWHLESELAYAWTSVGSLVSALEIFKRLRLWPEVALCLASTAASDDSGGRGAGGEEKARAIVRWRLFKRSSTKASPEASQEDSDDAENIDIDSIKPSDYCGSERVPPPPNAPRLFCILGDMENDAGHYTRAWEISNRRFARAQRSLGELHLQNKAWDAARAAYRLAVGVNRLSPDLWNRLGDIELRLGHFPDAAEAFQRAIATANDKVGGEDARTWSNLGTAFLSWHREVVAEARAGREKTGSNEDEEKEEAHGVEVEAAADGMASTRRAAEAGRSAPQLLQDALTAFKRGATVADSNWRIWDNVVTLAASLQPRPALDDVVLGVRNVIRIRKTEGALDVEILALLVREATKNPPPMNDGEGVYEPPRGSLESRVVRLFEEDVVPLITEDSGCWALASRLRAWRRDLPGALDAAEKGWRAVVGGAGVGSALSATTGQQKGGDWLTDAEAWDVVVQRTEELVAAYENYGPRVEGVGPDRWRAKARSAVRSVLGKAKEAWEGDERWEGLRGVLEGLR